MKRVLEFVNHNFGLIIIALLWGLLLVGNFAPDVWLSGWDNLHPEFDFILNIKRSFFAAWQEYQGLGLLGGMGHASDLLRQILLAMAGLVLPKILLRSFFHFLMLLWGPLGVYFLGKKYLFRDYQAPKKEIAGVGATLFYFFNLATLQMFYVPYEPFSIHFAFLPWLCLAALKVLDRSNRKSLGFFLLVNLLAISQGYVLTIFLVYLVTLCLLLLVKFLGNFKLWSRALIVLSLTFLINAFWLLPNLYFVATGANTNVEAKMNLMSTADNLLRNQKYGGIHDVALLKGFWFDNMEKGGGSEFYLMGKWVKHLQNPFILSVGYLLFAGSLVGIFISLRNKEKSRLFLPPFFLALVLLANQAPGFSQIAFIFYKIPLMAQVFRFPFTKFSILAALGLAIFFGVAVASLSSYLNKRKIWLVFFPLILPIIFLWPVFFNNLFYFKEKAKIPQEYFEVFDFFKIQDKNTRIANFPQPTYWGWTNYQWGNYSGSGFLWYGIQQPILDRTFDVWSGKNENYYWEISSALYAQNQPLFEKILEKYQINWLLVDENVVNPNEYVGLGIEKLNSFIQNSNRFSLAATFGRIGIYRFDLQNPINDFVFLAQDLPAVGPDYSWGNYDKAYTDNGNYFSNLQPSIFYPFRSLFTGRSTQELDFEIEENENAFIFKKKLPAELSGYQIFLPPETKELPWINPQNLSETRYATPEARLNADVLEIVIPKVGGYFSSQIDPVKEPSVLTAKNCNQLSDGKVSNESVKWDVGREVGVGSEENVLRLTATDANNCSAAFWLGNLLGRYSYLIKVNSHYQQGKSLLFWLENSTLQRADMELYLPKANSIFYLIQPPMGEYDLGYTLHFDNISIGRQQSVNDLGKIDVQPIPYRYLTGIVLKPVNSQLKTAKLSGVVVNHPNPSVYVIQTANNQLPTSNNQILILSQSYHPGWKAYWGTPIFGQEIKEHVLVNNWENGWLLPTANNQPPAANKKIVLVFWPQYLEYLGFVILGGTLVWGIIFWLKSKKTLQ